MDIVARLRQESANDGNESGLYADVRTEAADTIEFLRTEVVRLEAARHPHHPDLYAEVSRLRDEVDRLRQSSDSPVHGPELKRSLLAEGRYHAPECGGFQGFED